MNKSILLIILFLLVSFMIQANGEEDQSANIIGGEITVLTNRTDMVDKEFKVYKEAFEALYPGTTVNVEAMADYSGIVKIRMNTDYYGDVLLIPGGVTPEQFPDFFEPFGTVADLSLKYNLVTEKAFEGEVYGIPVSINANGIVYNKRVFREADIDELPKTPEAFIDCLKKIKANTDAIPYYTNYASGWALNQWEGNRTSVAGYSGYVNSLAHTDTPFAPGTPHYIIYKLLYDIVNQNLNEEDFTTTNWEASKVWLGNGQIATMVLGSWAIPQIQNAADDPNDVGYMPFPWNNNGIVTAGAGGDYKLAMNVHSKNKATARAWVDFFLNDSGFAVATGGIPPLKGSEMPMALQAFDEMGVELISDDPAIPGEEGWVDSIDQLGEIGLWEEDFKARIVESAFGVRPETFADIMNDLNYRWKEAREAVIMGK